MSPRVLTPAEVKALLAGPPSVPCPVCARLGATVTWCSECGTTRRVKPDGADALRDAAPDLAATLLAWSEAIAGALACSNDCDNIATLVDKHENRRCQVCARGDGWTELPMAAVVRIADELRGNAGAANGDPLFDATDGAHPAWWRGHDRAAQVWQERATTAERERDETRAELTTLCDVAREYLDAVAAIERAVSEPRAGAVIDSAAMIARRNAARTALAALVGVNRG